MPSTAEIVKTKLASLDIVLDTEVTLEAGQLIDRTKVSGLINSAMHGSYIDESKLVFNCFDSMAPVEFRQHESRDKYSARYAKTENVVKQLANSRFRLADSIEVVSATQAKRLFEEYTRNGFEGLILKSPEHLYTFKRTADWAKMKETKSADLKCVGYCPGTGKYAHSIGALLCSGTVEGVPVTVSVGSGLTDLCRRREPSNFVGKTIEVKYNSLVKDSKTQTYSLFLPRFVAVRFDK